MHSQPEIEKHAGTLAKQMIEENFVNPPSLTALAQASGLSPFQMSRLFYRVNQITIPHFIRKLRTDHAEELLRTTNRAVGQVAAEVGYMSMSAFCRAFVREKGKLPSDMRRTTAWSTAAATADTAAETTSSAA